MILRMLFVVCHEAIPTESQLVFTLKSLCGFSIKEVATRLFISEANAYKRFSRAKQYLTTQALTIDALKTSELNIRLTTVHYVLYLVFTEGYLSSHQDKAIRKDLCLVDLLSNSTIGNVPETYALLALMHFHVSRIQTRQDESGSLLLLEQQDRTLWDQHYIATGLKLLAQSAQGERLSRYHLEASIAAEHCLAPSYQETRWNRIVAAYDLLIKITPSALYTLNKAIAIAEWQGPLIGLKTLTENTPPSWLECSYHWYVVKADLLYRCNETTVARENAMQALQRAPTEHIKKLVNKRFSRYES